MKTMTIRLSALSILVSIIIISQFTYLLLFFSSSPFPSSVVYAQQANYTDYIDINNNDYAWLDNDQLVIYRKDPNIGLVKVHGPSSFQTITKAYLLANTPNQSDLDSTDQVAWNNAWQNIVNDLDNWVFVDKYAMYAIILEFSRIGENYDSIFHYLIKVDLTTQNIELHRSCSICNSTRWGGDIFYRQQLVDGMLIVYYLVDEDATPDIWYILMTKITSNTTIWHDNYSGPSNYLFTSDGANITKVISTYNNGLIGFLYNNCISYWAPNYKIVRFDKVVIYDSGGGCSQGNLEPTFQSLTQLGRSGSSVFVKQTLNSQTYYYKCELVSASSVVNSFSNCIDVDANDAFSTNILVTNPLLRSDQATAQNLPYPAMLFKSDSAFYKSKWFLTIDNTKVYASTAGTILSTNVNFVIRNLYAERPTTITNDPNKLGGLWKLRVVDSTDPNNVQTTEYNIYGIQMSNTLELNTLLTYFNPNNSNTIDVYLVWQITYNNELKERVFNLKFSKDTNTNIASIDISDPSVTLADLTVVFTDPNLANTNMFIKLQGFDVFVDMKKTAPDRIQFFTIEGNCYQIYKLNQTFTWLSNVCSVPPYMATIGPSDGREGGILIGIYWFPQWYVTHIYYQDTNTVDVIIHKTPPFTYKIKILDIGGNVFTDTNWQTSNTDPLTVNFTLGNDEKYKLVVYGKDNNIERIVYTADIIKKKQLEFFLPFASHGVNVMLLIVLASMLMWTKNNVAIGTVMTVSMLGLLNWLGLLQINDSLFMILIVLAGVGLIISKRLFS
ncbi:MAG: hypothetical protein QXQ68_07390 [Candidatus Nitrosocaldaceae archaeon]